MAQTTLNACIDCSHVRADFIARLLGEWLKYRCACPGLGRDGLTCGVTGKKASVMPACYIINPSGGCQYHTSRTKKATP